MIDAYIKFFDIKKCGFYSRGAADPVFGDINQSLTQLTNWARDGRDFVNTTTYESDPENDLLSTYFCDWQGNPVTQDSVLILWNETPNNNGTVYGMPPRSRPGDTAMLTTEFEGDAIPGMPSYFWFIPEHNLMASIRFQHSIAGKANAERYLNSYLWNKSPYRILNAESEVIGFSESGNFEEGCEKLHPKFVAMVRKNHQLIDYLLENRSRITRMIKRETLSYQSRDDRNIIERVFSDLLNNAPVFTEDRTINHTMQFRPTEQQLEQIVNNYDNLGPNSPIKDVGFILNTNEQIMLSGVSLSVEEELQVDRLENEIISADLLLNALSRSRGRLLNGARARD